MDGNEKEHRKDPDISTNNVSVVFFHFLEQWLKERGKPAQLEFRVPNEGIACESILSRLEVPQKMVEVVFINGRGRGLHEKAYPGDRVAFVPPGTPGPYRVLLGMRGRSGKQ